MRKVLHNFGSGWKEALFPKFTKKEIEDLENDEERSRVFRDFNSRACKPASERDASVAEEFLRNSYEGDYNSAVVILPGGHGHVCPKQGGRIAF